MEVVCAVYEPPLKLRIWLPTAALLTHQQHLWQVARCIASYNRLPGSLLSLQDKLFKHLKIRKWEINCIPDRWRRNFALWWMGYKWHLLRTAKCHMGGRRHMVWKLCVSCQFVTAGKAAGMFVKAKSVCVLVSRQTWFWGSSEIHLFCSLEKKKRRQ